MARVEKTKDGTVAMHSWLGNSNKADGRNGVARVSGAQGLFISPLEGLKGVGWQSFKGGDQGDWPPAPLS